eukprot:3040265-Rhodomonas_salina.1
MPVLTWHVMATLSQCAVAGVPFVDVMTTMVDPSIPVQTAPLSAYARARRCPRMALPAHDRRVGGVGQSERG